MPARRRLAPALALSSLVVAALGAAGVAWWLRPAPVPDEPPSVLLVTIDTLRADRLGIHGGPRGLTPVLDRLAGRGAWFADAEAVAPSTLASHASLFTGLHAHEHGVHRNGWKLSPSAVTLAERFAEAGWETAAFVSSFAVVGETGIDQGFRTFDDGALQDLGGFHVEQRAEDTNARVMAWWNARPDKRARYFVWVHYFDPHYPYKAPRRYRARFSLEEPEEVRGSMRDVEHERMRFRRSGERSAVGRKLASLYDAEVAYTDHALGELLDTLDAGGALDEAVVVVTSDHGETFDEHRLGAFDHGQNVYRTNLHVPLVFWGRGYVPRRGRIDGPATLLDVAPTLAELARLPGPQLGPGASLLPALRGIGEVPRGRTLFGEATRGRHPFKRPDAWPNADLPRVAREGTVRRLMRPGARKGEELFDVARDPAEADDRTSDPAYRAARDRLRAAQEGFDRSQARFAGAEHMADLDALEKLKALGYVDDAEAVAVGQAGAAAGEGAAPEEGSGADPEDGG